MARRGTILACLLLLGCGPLTATSAIDDAERALARARAADSDRYAGYETTLAELYLAKARQEQGYAQYGEARSLASEALFYANAASRKVAERGGDPAAQSPKRSAVQQR